MKLRLYTMSSIDLRKDRGEKSNGGEKAPHAQPLAHSEHSPQRDRQLRVERVQASIDASRARAQALLKAHKGGK